VTIHACGGRAGDGSQQLGFFRPVMKFVEQTLCSMKGIPRPTPPRKESPELIIYDFSLLFGAKIGVIGLNGSGKEEHDVEDMAGGRDGV